MIPEAAVEAWVVSAHPHTIVGRLRDERKNVTSQVIPEVAVEAAAKWLHDNDCRSALHSGFPADFECYGWLDEARELLEAAAPFMRQAFFLEMNLCAVQDELRAAPIYPLGKVEDKRP